MTQRVRIVSSAMMLFALATALVVSAVPSRATVGTSTPESGTAPCQLQIDGTPVGNAATPPPVASPVINVPFDLLVLDLMIRQRQRIQAVGGLASAGADHAELADAGRSLAADAAADVVQLRGWRAAWYGDVPPLTDREIARELDRIGRKQGLQRGIPGTFEILAMGHLLDDLCHASAPPDLALVESLIPALNAELLLARSALDLAVHPELKKLAQRLIDQDQPRLDALIAWRSVWFPSTPSARATPLP